MHVHYTYARQQVTCYALANGISICAHSLYVFSTIVCLENAAAYMIENGDQINFEASYELLFDPLSSFIPQNTTQCFTR